MAKIGRNDPCPCGSGKKYKRCCQDKIEAEERQKNAQANSSSEFSPDDIQEMTKNQHSTAQTAILKAALERVKKLPDNERGELDHITWKLETVMQFFENKSAIIKCVDLLDQYRDEFMDWTQSNATEIFQHTVRLFSEPPFEKMIFTEEDIERTIKVQGSPPYNQGIKPLRGFFSKTFNQLLDSADLQTIAFLLLLQVPKYYSRKRYMDAWLIVNNAYQIIAFNEKGNDIIPAFLICKFNQAAQKWMKVRDRETAGFLQSIGLSIDEIQTKFQGKGNDLDFTEDQKARFIKYLQEHPDVDENLQAELAEQEETLTKLLGTREGELLLFRGKEMEPWIARFAKAVEGDQRLQKNLNPQTMLSEQENIAIFSEIMEKFSAEMANEVFTGKRVARLNKDIQTLQKNLLKQGRKEYNSFLDNWLAINKTLAPKFSPVNVLLCKLSLTKLLQQAAIAMQKNRK